MVDLRPYQREAIAAVHRSWADGESPLLVLSTGCGKTITALALAADIIAQGGRVVYVAHRLELITQPAIAARALHLDVGIVRAEDHAPDADLVIASVQTLIASPHRATEIGPVDLLIVDEAHHAVSPSHQAAIAAIPHARRLGLTATPHRDDGASLEADGWTIAYSYGIAEAVAGGWLLPPMASVSRLRLDLTAASRGRTDYIDAELGAELLRAGVVEHTVAAVAATHEARCLLTGRTTTLTARGRCVLVYTATVEQARLTSDALNAAGWRSAWVSGETVDRGTVLDALVTSLDVLCRAAVLT